MENLTNKTSAESIFEILTLNFSFLPENESFTKEVKEKTIQRIVSDIMHSISNNLLKERLELLYNYEKNYLELTKAYKEEIKFAANLQEDLRKERAKFFSEVLQDVHKTLEDVKMDKGATDLWITELVSSYTKSLDISSELAKDHVLDTMGKLRDDSRKDIGNIAEKKKKDE
jgi:hypothetical protein